MSDLDILTAAIFCPGPQGLAGLPLLLISKPGAGKTSIVKAVAAKYGMSFKVLSPGLQGEGGFGVIMVPGKDGYLHALPPAYAKELDDNPNGAIVLVDEVTTAPDMLQPPMLGLVADHRIGDHTFAPKVRVIGAANPPEFAANGHPLPAALANRFGHLAWNGPTVGQHIAYMAGSAATMGKGDTTEIEKRVAQKWPVAFAKACGLEAAFLTKCPDYKHQCPKASDPKASGAWPSDRSWELATRALAAAFVHDLTEVDRDELVRSFIGAEAYKAWSMAMDLDLPDPDKVLDGEVEFKHDPARLDLTAGVLASCSALVCNKNCEHRAKRAAKLWTILATIDQEDLSVPFCAQLTNAGVNTLALKESAPVLSKINDVVMAMRAAGV